MYTQKGAVVSDGTIKLDWSNLPPLLTPSLRDTFKHGAQASYEEITGGPFDQVNERALAYAEERAAELVGMKWVDGELVENPNAEWSISESTRDSIQSIIERALREGMSPDQAAQEIRDAFDFSEARAELVSRTELAMAQEAGALEGWRESGVVSGKLWLLSNDHPYEDGCDENADAGVIGIDDLFPSGDDAPPLHPACECDCVAVLDDGSESDGE